MLLFSLVISAPKKTSISVSASISEISGILVSSITPFVRREAGTKATALFLEPLISITPDKEWPPSSIICFIKPPVMLFAC